MYLVDTDEVTGSTKTLDNTLNTDYFTGDSHMKSAVQKKTTTKNHQIANKKAKSSAPYQSRSFNCTWMVAD